MISIYREGGMAEIGMNIGWVRGPVVCFIWYSLRTDTMRKWYFRLRDIPGHRFIYRKEHTQPWKASVLQEYLFNTDQRLVTREVYEDFMGGVTNV